MYKDNKHILFFDFLENHYDSKKFLNILKTSFTKEEGRKVVKTSHPPLETILVSVKGKEVRASPFKISDSGPTENVFAEIKKIIEQNNFVNQTLHTIGQQLDRIEDKVEKPVFEKPASKNSIKTIEKPLIVLPPDRSKIHFGVTSTMAKLDQMLAEVKQEKPSCSVINRNGPGVSFDDSFSVNTWNDSDNDVSLSDNFLVQNIDLLEKEFQGLQVEKPELARIYSRDIKPIGLTKNWYSRPTPPDLQYEERGSHSQFSVSADQMYAWNIDGFSEQEILNTLNRMSMVAIAYFNNKLSQTEIVDILTSGFSGMLRAWWDKHLTAEDRETIRVAVKRDTDGLPILPPEEDRREGTHGSPDGVNTLIFTIVKHFVGTPSNITNRISDYLNNLRCNKMSDYRWYKDVFMSRVMLRDDSQKPYWKEKFIDGLPRLFAIKVKDSLTDITGYLNYDNYTYGDIVSVIQKLSISMCNDQRMIAQQMKDRKKAKYEMGNFCEQFGLPPIAPSVQRRKSSKKFAKPRRNYNRSREEFYKKPVSKSVSKKKPFHKKVSKTPAKGTCFNCGQPGHYANKCTKKPQGFKKKLNELNINSIDQEDLFRLLEHGSPTSSDDDELSSSGSDYHSDSDHINSPNIKFGCNDSCCASKVKTINVLDGGREQGPVLNKEHVLSKEQEHENMLLSIISQIQDPELKEKYLKKLKETMTRKEPSTSKGKISFEETLGRFQKQKPKDISLNDLQHEVSLVKREITELREEIKNLKSENASFKQDLACLKLDIEFDHDSPSGEESNQSDHAEPSSPTKEICLVHRSVPQKWFYLVEIVVNHEYRFSAVALIDSGADLNCIQEGLVPTSYFEKSEENLFSANGSKMKIRYELNTAHVCQDNVCFKIPSVLVKNLTHDVILGMPFLNMIYPFLSEADGITTDPFGQKVKFKIASKFERDTARRSVFLLSAKRKHLDFLKQEIKFKRISDNLHDPLLRSKIEDFQKTLISEVCSDIPNAFWHRKKHVVSLPYVKDFSENLIPTKARPIQMNRETLEFCKNEIQDLLAKNIIRHSRSPWSCAAFYVQKNAEIERGTPRLVINYKPLNKVLEWIRYPIPNKNDLVHRLSDAIVFSKFDLKSGFWQIQIRESDRYKTAFTTPFGHYEWNVMPFGLKNAPSEFQNIMNDIFLSFTDFTIVYIDDVLVFSKSIDEH
ncbi:hypothetical protein I3760_10G086900 [Carya illinoinensis]|nr:hypothetical protein I3760_10G086900 [Carya illinoinensis]